METLPDDAVDNEPGKTQEAEQIPLDGSHLVNAVTHVENLVAVEEEILRP